MLINYFPDQTTERDTVRKTGAFATQEGLKIVRYFRDLALRGAERGTLYFQKVLLV